MVDLWNPGNQFVRSKTKRAAMEMRMSRHAVLGPALCNNQGGLVGVLRRSIWDRLTIRVWRLVQTSTGDKHLLMWVHRFCGWYSEMLSGACPAVMVAETSQNNMMRRWNLPCGLVQGSTYQEWHSLTNGSSESGGDSNGYWTRTRGNSQTVSSCHCTWTWRFSVGARKKSHFPGGEK